MGAEARVQATIDGKRLPGKALLETAELVFRPDGGGARLVFRFAELETAAAVDGVLELVAGGRRARLELGELAGRWLKKIRNPPGRLDKLGVKPGLEVVLRGVADPAFEAELAARGARLTVGRLKKGADLVFLGAETRAALAGLAAARAAIQPAGAIWVIRPKGAKAITEADVMAAGKAAGLVDVKVASFSRTHTAEKLVIPVSRR
jgi:hypothetical protein